ncbi:MAG: hypothetical protein WBA22_01925, partial [Candidatus Methanofastidiosia archaeon]
IRELTEEKPKEKKDTLEYIFDHCLPGEKSIPKPKDSVPERISSSLGQERRISKKIVSHLDLSRLLTFVFCEIILALLLFFTYEFFWPNEQILGPGFFAITAALMYVIYHSHGESNL